MSVDDCVALEWLMTSPRVVQEANEVLGGSEQQLKPNVDMLNQKMDKDEDKKEAVASTCEVRAAVGVHASLGG